MPGRDGRLGPALLLLVGCVSALVLAEVAVRIFDPHAHDHAMPGGFFAMDDTLGWRQRPGLDVRHHTRYFDVSYRTNSRGFRDPERPLGKTPGRTRVAVFGDSQVFGWGIPLGHRFTDLLERQTPRLEVWNLAVMGYGFDQELLTYELRGRAWAPDVVVLFATTATLRRAETGRIYQKEKPRYVLEHSGTLRLALPEPGATRLREAVYRLLSGFYLPYFLERRFAMIGERWRTTGREAPAVTELTRALVDRAAGLARRRGARLVVLADLPPDQLAPMRAIAESLEVTVVDAGLPIDRAPFTNGPMDPHWNARGQEQVARALAPALMPADTIRH